jgi:hypothetical protein
MHSRVDREFNLSERELTKDALSIELMNRQDTFTVFKKNSTTVGLYLS